MTTEDNPLGSPKTAPELLDMYYLLWRSALLETAAGFDRLQRSSGFDQLAGDPRLEKLKQACAILQRDESDRTEAILHLLSEEAS